MTARDDSSGAGKLISFPAGGKRPHPDEQAADEALGMGMLLFLGSLGVLFAASIAGCLIVLSRQDGWQFADRGALVRGLWISTGILVLVSAAMQAAYESLARSRPVRFRRLLGVGLVFVLVFLGNQAINWADLLASALGPSTKDLHVFSFYMLTTIHAAHVVGGLVPQLFVMKRAKRGRYHAGKMQGVKALVLYWHFLGGAWLLIHAAVQIVFLR